MRNYKDKINKVGDYIEGIDTINAGEFNSISKELKNVLNSASIPLGDLNESGEDILNNQLAQAIYKLIQISNNWQDISIEPNNLILNKSDNVVLTPTPIVGSKIQWVNQYANTGTVSIKVGTYAITNLKTLNNNDLSIDDLKANSFYSAVFDGVNWRVEQISSQSFTGMIYCGVEQPNSLLCNGNAISRVQYARLFSKIGNRAMVV